MKTIWKKHDFNTIKPADQAALDFLGHTKIGKEFMAETYRPRNLKHHKWLFGLLQVVIENTDRYPDVDTLLFALKIATGMCTPFPSADGKTVFVKEKSIAFESMDQDAFAAWVERVVRVIVTKILPGVNSDRLTAAVEERIAGFY